MAAGDRIYYYGNTKNVTKALAVIEKMTTSMAAQAAAAAAVARMNDLNRGK